MKDQNTPALIVQITAPATPAWAVYRNPDENDPDVTIFSAEPIVLWLLIEENDKGEIFRYTAGQTAADIEHNTWASESSNFVSYTSSWDPI